MRLNVENAQRIGSAMVAAGAAIIVVTCAGSRQPGQPVTAPSTEPAPRPKPPAPAESTGLRAKRTDAAAPASKPFRLARLFENLADLESGARGDHVRVLWLGDSHTHADFWTHAARIALQERFGNGGPGFFLLGMRTYRHSGFLLTVEGAWNLQPAQPSQTRRESDGVFGLGGIRTVARSSARIHVTLRDGIASGPLRWEIAYRLDEPGDAFSLKTTGQEKSLVQVEGAVDGGGGIQHVRKVTDAKGALVLTGARGTPQILGAVAETSKPGVVLDTVGINGARIGTPLAWDPATWIAEVKRRAPSLVVIAFGTNEAGDATAVEKYPPQFRRVLDRVRAASPKVACLMVGPTDRADPQWNTLPRLLEIEAMQRETSADLGCEYFSVFEAMGGREGIKRWAQKEPPLAHGDRVHLTPKGYTVLGRQIARRIIDGYDAWRAQKKE